MKYLERGAVLKEINRSLSFVDCPPVIINIVNSIILNIPAANAEYKKHGYWKFSDNPDCQYQCSVCGKETKMVSCYCPYCGAYLFEGDEFR